MAELAVFQLVLLALLQLAVLKRKLLSKALALSLIAHNVLWVSFPVIYRLVFPVRGDGWGSLDTYYEVVNWQLFVTLVCIALASLIVRLLTDRTSRSTNRTNTATNPNFVVWLLVIALTIDLLQQLYSVKTSGSSFLDRSQHGVLTEGKGDLIESTLSGIDAYIMPFVTACLASRNVLLQRNPWIVRLSFIEMATFVAFMFIYGVRAMLFYPLIFIGIYLDTHKHTTSFRAKATAVLVAGAIVVAAPVLSSTMKSARADASYQADAVLSETIRRGSSDSDDFRIDVLEDLHTKFSEFENGAILLDAEGASRAGFSLIESSLESPIPRALYPTKPVPFSRNGEYSGIPYYLVPHILGATASNVVPVAPSAIALWELGIAGIFFLIFANAVNLIIADLLLRSNSLLQTWIGFCMISLPTFEYLIAPTGWLIKEDLKLALILVAVIVTNRIIAAARTVIGRSASVNP